MTVRIRKNAKNGWKPLLLLFTCLALLATTSCVSKKKYQEIVSHRDNLQSARNGIRQELTTCDNNLDHAQNRVKALEGELAYFKSTNTNLLDRLADLSVVSITGAESIKKSLDALNEQNRYIKNLTTSMREKDSLNLVLALNLKRSLADLADDDVVVEVKKGVVYISLSDKMLFKTASARIQPTAEVVLSKIAQVVNDHQNLDILVEGHTDSVPIKTECLSDNWDLSAQRATSVVRTLQSKHGVDPQRMTAGGRGEYVPKASNDNAEGKSLNRRTEIIILPKMDEFFQLLQPPN